MNTPPPTPPTPPTPPDDPLTDRVKGITKGIGYLIASTLGILFLIYALSANMHRGRGGVFFWLAIICISGLIKGLAYILKGNQKVQEEEQKKQQQEEGCCSRAFIITIVIIFILALACCLFVSLFGG